MLDRIEFLLAEALVAIRRNGWMTFAAVSTATVALFLLGGLGHLYMSLDTYASKVSSRFEMRAFLRDGSDRQAISATARRIRALPNVREVTWIPKEGAWERYCREHPDLTAGLVNPYPDALKVKLSNLESASSVAAEIAAVPTIDTNGVVYLDDEQRLVAEAQRLIRWMGAILVGLSLLTAGILIFNAIRATVLARRREVRIMQLVGASHATIQIPFLLEGAVQGALGGALSGMLLLTLHALVVRFLSNFDAIGQPGAFPFWPATLLLTAAGALFGAACSLLAVWNPMKLGSAAP